MTNNDTVISFEPAMGIKPIHLDGHATSEQIAKAVTDALAPRYGLTPDDLSMWFEDDGVTATVREALGFQSLTTVTIVRPAQAVEAVTLTPEQLHANLLLAVEHVIAAGHLDWDSGLDVDGIRGRAHTALVEAYQAVTK